MAKIVVLGAGIAGHTASALLKKKLGKKHEVIVVTPNAYYHWIPSNIWVGVGRMTVDQVRFKLDKRYQKVDIVYKQAKAVSFHPEGDNEIDKGFVTIFDGTDLSKLETEGNWKIQDDGSLYLEPRDGEEGWKRYHHYLWLKDNYGDFVFETKD